MSRGDAAIQAIVRRARGGRLERLTDFCSA